MNHQHVIATRPKALVAQRVFERCVRFLLLLFAFYCIGCTTDDVNPLFPLVESEARAALKQMRSDPVQPIRPILIAGGIADPGVVAHGLSNDLRDLLHEDAQIARVSFFTTLNFDACRDRMIATVEDAWPRDCDHETVEVDVVAYSMGGLVARYAALPRTGDDDAGKRLRIARLFTIATPHRGATLANLPTLDARAIYMRGGSEFLNKLDTHLQQNPYPIYAYVRLGDAIVGSDNAAPTGCEAWWVPNQPLSFSHLSAASDPRILADIARRLRGETPWSRRAHELERQVQTDAVSRIDSQANIDN